MRAFVLCTVRTDLLEFMTTSLPILSRQVRDLIKVTVVKNYVASVGCPTGIPTFYALKHMKVSIRRRLTPAGMLSVAAVAKVGHCQAIYTKKPRNDCCGVFYYLSKLQDGQYTSIKKGSSGSLFVQYYLFSTKS